MPPKSNRAGVTTGDWAKSLAGTLFGAFKQAVSALLGLNDVRPGVVVISPVVTSMLTAVSVLIYQRNHAGWYADGSRIVKRVASHHRPWYSLPSLDERISNVQTGSVAVPARFGSYPCPWFEPVF
jgi:hypothetical protein